MQFNINIELVQMVFNNINYVELKIENCNLFEFEKRKDHLSVK